MTLAYAGQYKSWKISRTDADIASTATGREFLKVPVPKPYNAFVMVTGDDQGDFVLAAQHITRPERFGLPMPTRLYLVQVDGDGPGAAYRIQALPASLTAGGFIPEDGLALASDGSRLAISQGSPPHGLPRVTVFSFVTGRTTIWQLPASMIGSPNLHVEVDWNTAFVTPDGSHVLRSASVPIPISRNGYYVRPRIYDYSASTGRLLKTTTGPRDIDWALLWTSPDGQSVIRSAVKDGLGNGFIKAAIFTGGHWRPFRLPPQSRTAAW